MLFLVASLLLVTFVLGGGVIEKGSPVFRVRSERTPDTASVRRVVDSLQAERRLSIDAIEWSNDSTLVIRIAGDRFVRRDRDRAGACTQDTAVLGAWRQAALRVYAPSAKKGSITNVKSFADYIPSPLGELIGLKLCRDVHVVLYDVSQFNSMLRARAQ